MHVKIWNGKCDDMRNILSASGSWQEFIEFLSAYSDTLYITNIKFKRVEQMNGSRMMKDMEWIMNDKQAMSMFQGVSPVDDIAPFHDASIRPYRQIFTNTFFCFLIENLNEIVPKSRSQWGLGQEPHWGSRTSSKSSSKVKNLIKNLLKNQEPHQEPPQKSRSWARPHWDSRWNSQWRFFSLIRV